MNSKVCIQTLWVGRIGLLWYCVGAILVVAAGGAGLSSIQSNAQAFEQVLQGLPPALLEAFKINLSSFTSNVGYICARSLSLLFPLLVLAFASGSAGSIVQMIERGTIHFELSLPVSRTAWFLGRVLASLLGIVVLVLVTWVALSVFAAAHWWHFAILGLVFALLWLSIAYVAATFVRDRGMVVAVVFGLFATQFLLATLSGVVDGLGWLETWNLWSAYRPEVVVNTGVPWNTVGVWFSLSIALFAFATWRWRNRDLPA